MQFLSGSEDRKLQLGWFGLPKEPFWRRCRSWWTPTLQDPNPSSRNRQRVSPRPHRAIVHRRIPWPRGVQMSNGSKKLVPFSSKTLEMEMSVRNGRAVKFLKSKLAVTVLDRSTYTAKNALPARSPFPPNLPACPLAAALVPHKEILHSLHLKSKSSGYIGIESSLHESNSASRSQSPPFIIPFLPSQSQTK